MEQGAEVLFRRALEAAAKALRDLESDQIPADLRRVARRPLPLPPPLAVSLLKGLDRYEWLREKAAEVWPEADPEAPGPDRASALLLLRPPGWTAQLAALVAELAAGQTRRADEDLGRQLETARAEAGEWRRRARTEKETGEETARELRRALNEERAARAALQAAPLRAEAARQEEIDRLRAELTELTARHEDAQRAERRCQSDLAEQRRARATAEAQLAEAGPAASWGGDVLDLAARLDLTAMMMRPPVKDGPPPGALEEVRPLRLPRRVHPDRKEAIDWLVAREEGAVVIVDGYNLAFKLVGSGEVAVGREKVLMLLDRLRRAARGPLRAVVVFDSRLETTIEVARPGPVEIRFTSGEGGADGEIVSLAGELAGARVVVSSDREVREQAEAAGALALWSEALVDWSQRR